MKIEIPTAVLAQVATLFKSEDGGTPLQEHLQTRVKSSRSMDVGTIDLTVFNKEELTTLHQFAKEKSYRGLLVQVSAYRNLVGSPFDYKIPSLKTLPAGLIAFITQHSIDGWLYQKELDGTYSPWLVRAITYESQSQHSPAHVTVRMSANVSKDTTSRNGRDDSSQAIAIFADDIVKKTIGELLANKGYYHETPDLKERYEADLATFQEYRDKVGAQFLATGTTTYTERYQTMSMNFGNGAKMVNDEGSVTRTLLDEVDSAFWESKPGSPDFSRQPYHCRLHMFHLERHMNIWVHVSNLAPYKYQPELREKLVLPELHRDLIDVLTQDMDFLLEDMVAGKTGGTTILCKGPAGLGKTLTAEVYSEVVGRPLYRVHSGQLGTTAEQVEQCLGEVLGRAQAWGAVLLIDEADVFVRERGNDIEHNAVVAVFLRSLEYFNGLLFMTTNRANDIDDAILSRCIAIVNYTKNEARELHALWKVLSVQFEVPVSDALREQLVSSYPGLSGRDIKELLKLTGKYARRMKLPADFDAFRKCAMFRALDGAAKE